MSIQAGSTDVFRRSLYTTLRSLQQSASRIASGTTLGSAADDAASLQISTGLVSQLRGAGAALDNVQSGANTLTVAEAGLSQIQQQLSQVRELTVQAANGTNGTQARAAIQKQINGHLASINRLAKTTDFAGVNLLGSAAPSQFLVQTGNGGAVDIGAALGNTSASALGLDSVDIGTASSAAAALTSLDAALSEVSDRRSAIGASYGSLESAANSISVDMINTASANSRLSDPDVVHELMQMTQNKIRAEAQIALYAQINRLSSGLFRE